MHELSLLRDVLGKIDRVAEAEGVSRVCRVTVRIGALAHISADHFRGHFEAASIGRAAEGAELRIDMLTDQRDPLAQAIVLTSVEVVA